MPLDQQKRLLSRFILNQGIGEDLYQLIQTMFPIHCMQHLVQHECPAMGGCLVCRSRPCVICLLYSLDNPIPDHTTIMNFQTLIRKTTNSRRQLFKEVNSNGCSGCRHLSQKGSTIVDCGLLIEAASQTKN